MVGDITQGQDPGFSPRVWGEHAIVNGILFLIVSLATSFLVYIKLVVLHVDFASSILLYVFIRFKYMIHLIYWIIPLLNVVVIISQSLICTH